jgi:SAM-dependent methyltransferase
MRSLTAQARGVVGAVRRGHAGALALAIADSRALVRSLFLASAVRLDVLAHLVQPRSLDELGAFTGATRTDRLTAWLDVGVALRELRVDGDGRYRLRGRRARALADGDPVLVAHYRSMLDYQPGPYEELAELLRSAPGEGRDDLDRHATVIADVSRAAQSFVTPYLEEIVRTRRPRRVLDAGCGTGVYLQAMLQAAPEATGDGIDLAPDVVDAARARLAAAGLAGRATISTGDVREFAASTAARYDLVTLINDVYYFDRDERVARYRQLREDVVADDGELVVVTMVTRVTPGSPASAHLHLMLVSQAGHASLPRDGEIERDLRAAGFATVETTRLVPTEPFVGVRAC